MRPTKQRQRGRQKGEIQLARTLLIVGILLAMLVLPLWLKKGSDDKSSKTRKEEAQAAGVAPGSKGPTAATAQAAPVTPRPIGFGLTFALAAPDDKAPADVVSLSCHGEPRTLDRPHKGSCNPYDGDTSCRVVLPVLCLKPSGASKPTGVVDGFYQGWTGGTLAATQPVMGAILESASVGSARCEAELGAGWRMAEFHDGQGGWGLQGLRGQGFAANARYWVHVNDQRGNCWDSAP